MSNCYCGEDKPFEECCKPLIDGTKEAGSALDLMRAHYSALASGAIDFIGKTTAADSLKDFNKEELESWANNAEWAGLEIKATTGGDDEGKATVEFVAHYKEDGKDVDHHAKSEFVKEDGKWRFVDSRKP